MVAPELSVIIPVYKNKDTILTLLDELQKIALARQLKLETVVVIDGCPEQSQVIVEDYLSKVDHSWQLIEHSRNFGSFAAIRTGLLNSRAPVAAVISADLQEEPALVFQFFDVLTQKKLEIVYGSRSGREDPLFDRMLSNIFWSFYRRFVFKEFPEGGIDLFACNRKVIRELRNFSEHRSSLVAQLMWMGFKREFISYKRHKRQFGKSAWTFRKKFNYLADSIYSFTQFPIRLLYWFSSIAFFLSLIIGGVSTYAKITGRIDVPGYTTILSLLLFFSSIQMASMAILGSYIWRAFENSKARPLQIIRQITRENKTNESLSSSQRNL